MKAKAIDTPYRGRLFRSRLEARWAIFFDVLGILWDYEPEGYELDGIRYLPDFWLPQVKMWAEVKPVPLTEAEREKARRLVRFTGFPVLMLVDLPDFKNYYAIERDPWGGSDDIIAWWDYSLVTKMIHKGEHRFPCSNFLPDNQPDAWGADYCAAVVAARSARFEFQQQRPRVYV